MHVGNHTFASVRGHETFEFLRDSLAPVWNEVGELTANPTLCVNDVQYSLQVVFGADYKVGMHVRKLTYVHQSTCKQYLLLMMGLNNATSIYSCIWCTVSKEERYMYMYMYMCTYIYMYMYADGI